MQADMSLSASQKKSLQTKHFFVIPKHCLHTMHFTRGLTRDHIFNSKIIVGGSMNVLWQRYIYVMFAYFSWRILHISV